MRTRRSLLVAVALVSVATAGCRLFTRSLPADFRGGGLELVYAMARVPDAMTAEQEAFVITQRIVKLGLCQPAVKVAGRELTVRLPAECGPGIERIKGRLKIRGHLELREVDDGEALTALAGRVPPSTGIALSVDRWTAPGAAGPRQAQILEGPAAELERFRASLPADAVPPSVEALVESPSRRGRPARLYLVRREAQITSTNLYDTRVRRDRNTQQPAVLLEFDLRGTERLRALTARLTGRKLAIVLDGRIMVAPVVVGTINTGVVQIVLAPAADVTKASEEANDLAQALRAGVLPAALTLVRESTIPKTR